MSILSTHDQVPQISRPAALPYRVAAGPPGGAGMTGKDIARAMLARKWVIIISVLATLAISLAIHYVWIWRWPLYQPEAVLGVQPPRPTAVGVVATETPRDVMDRMAIAAVRMVKAPDVLEDAVKSEPIQKSKYYHDDPANAVLNLSKHIHVTAQSSEGAIVISMWGTDKDETTNIVNAVADAALRYSDKSAKGDALKRTQDLTKERDNQQARLDDLRKKVASLHPVTETKIIEADKTITDDDQTIQETFRSRRTMPRRK